MKKAPLMLLALLSVAPLSLAQKLESQFKDITDKLETLTKFPLTDCRWHADVAHPESSDLDDSSWTHVSVGSKFNSGVQALRCWFTVPQDIDGYALRGATIRAAFDLQGDGMTMLSIFSNSYNIYRGDADTLEPLVVTTDAVPGQRILIAIRLEIGDQPRTLSRSEVLVQVSPNRPDPGLLRIEILSLEPLLHAYPDLQRDEQLASAVHAIDFSKLRTGDQTGFDQSLKAAQDHLMVLQPWVRQFRVRAVGNSHIDMAWLWPWTETVEVVRNTFRSALNLMHEYPGFTFTASTARAYEWMEEKYPDLFHEIQQRVQEGRWEVVGGMWVEPDLNMPSGESLSRQILIGKRYFKQKFGVDVNIGWNPDSFGYNWQLPQIYKKSGIDYFVTQKLLWAHEFTTFPYKLFWWQAPDGSKLLTYFPHDYGSVMEPVSMAEDVATWTAAMYPNHHENPEIMYLYGVGDHGGGPTRAMLDQSTKLMKADVVFPKIEFSTAASFLSDIKKEQSDLKIPVWQDELYFQYHRGVFTTQAETKKRIRQTEETLLDAEKFASVAQLFGRAYPHEEFTGAWKGLLFDQFHDIMPGSGIAVNYVDAKRDLAVARNTGTAILTNSLGEISAHINTERTGTPVVVYNSMSWPRKEVIEAEAQLPAPVTNIEVVDSIGKVVPSQVLHNDSATHRITVLIQAGVPAMGYATFFVRAGIATSPSAALKAGSTSLENDLVRLSVDPQTGCITSLYDKADGIETLAPSRSDTGGPTNQPCGNLLQTFHDLPKEYDAWNIDADFEKQYWSLDKADALTLMESGPLRAVIRVKHHFRQSSFVQDITMYAGSPRIDVNMRADWHERHTLLKVAFPVNAASQEATYEIPFGSIERPTTRNTPEEQAQFEVPAERWADVSDANGGLSLLNDCKYGYDAKANVLRLSLLRSPTFPDPDADQGEHSFTYSLYPHRGTWRDAGTIRYGYELNYKMKAVQVPNHTGDLPPAHSFLNLEAGNVVLTAVKNAEDRGAMILRFYEWAGKEGKISLQLPAGAVSVVETNMIEQPIGDLPLTNGRVMIETKPFEIKTIAVKFAAPAHP